MSDPVKPVSSPEAFGELLTLPDQINLDRPQGEKAEALCAEYELSKALLSENSWSAPIAQFIEKIEPNIDSGQNEALALGLLARLFEKAYARHRQQGFSTEQFGMRVFNVLSKLNTIPTCLTSPRETTTAKRAPSFFESLEGTLARYAFMEKLPETFGSVGDAVIVGGSMGYGPFYSVRHGYDHGDPSDVDAIVVLGEDYQDPEKWEQIARSSNITREDSRSFVYRLGHFVEMLGDGKADVISQRFDVPGQNFNMSAHFFPLKIFEAMNRSKLKVDLETDEDTVLAIRDFKPRRFEHQACNQQSFDGSIYNYVVPDHIPVKGGYVVDIPGYIVNGGKLYPGLYQNLISPEFEVYFDETGETSSIVYDFRDTVLECIRKERARSGVGSLALSHIRHQVFSPGRYDLREGLAV